MWSQESILLLLKQNTAHEELCKKKMSRIKGEIYWVSGYEYGLFCSPATCVLLAKTMQLNGTVYEERISPLVQKLARNRDAHIRIMSTMYWDLDTVRAFANRQDGHFFLVQGDPNGYEVGFMEDEHICRRLGFLASHYAKGMTDVIRYKYYKQAPLQHIKAFFE